LHICFFTKFTCIFTSISSSLNPTVRFSSLARPQDKKEAPWHILTPQSPVRAAWDALCFLLYLQYAVMLPFAACFAPAASAVEV
jgi:hypothetical protein